MIVRAAVTVDDARRRVGTHATAAGGVILVAQAGDLSDPSIVGLRELIKDILNVLPRGGCTALARGVDPVLNHR